MAGQYAESLDRFRQLEQEGAADGGWFYLNAGQSALAIKKEAIGMAWLERAREDPETRRAASTSIARYHLSLGRWDEGQRTLSEALLKDPDDAELHRLRAFARYHSGDPTGAIQDLERVLELDPSDEVSRERLATLRQEHGGP
jgi:tetratricopeptide (TPR) repeat protein